jgi:hypothetical protein
MSYGPGPSIVGTLFTNADNNTWSPDAALATGICPAPDYNAPGDGSGDGGGTGGCGVVPLPSPAPPPSDGGGLVPLPSPVPVSPGGGGLIPLPSPVPAPPPSLIIPFATAVGSNSPCAAVASILPIQTGSGGQMPVSGVGPGCVTPATRIALFPDGCMAAAEVQPGDLLLTRRADGTTAGEVVTAVRSSMQPRVLLETEDGRQLHCSFSHEVMVADPELPQGRRTVVSDLTPTDRLLREDGMSVGLQSMVRQPDGLVIQLSQSGPEHLYLSEGLWSHNKDMPDWPLPP